MLNTPLFYTEKIELTPIDLEKDCEVESEWTRDLRYAYRRRGNGIAKPYAAFEVKSDWEKRIQKSNENKLCFSYAIRNRVKQPELIGFFLIGFIEWKNQLANFKIIFKDESTEINFLDDAILLMKHLMVDELNIHYSFTEIPAFAEFNINTLIKHGFKRDVTRRNAAFFDGKYWDQITLGFLSHQNYGGEGLHQ